MYVCFFKGVRVQTSNYCPLEKGIIQRRQWVYLSLGEGWFNKKHCNTEYYSFRKIICQVTSWVTSWGFFSVEVPQFPCPTSSCSHCALTVNLPPSTPFCHAASWLWPLKLNLEIASPVYTAVMLLLFKMSDRGIGIALLQFVKKMAYEWALNCAQEASRNGVNCVCVQMLKMSQP